MGVFEYLQINAPESVTHFYRTLLAMEFYEKYF